MGLMGGSPCLAYGSAVATAGILDAETRVSDSSDTRVFSFRSDRLEGREAA